MDYDPFDATMDQILEAEREMRNLAEKEAVECRKTMMRLLARFAPAELERMKKADPRGWDKSLTPDDMERMIVDAVTRQRWNTNAVVSRDPVLEKELERLKEENAKLKLQVEKLQEELQERSKEQETGDDQPSAAPEITIPPFPPVKYRSSFLRWHREGFVIALVAKTGWSMRLALAEALAERDDGLTSYNAGSVRRMFDRMEKEGFITSHTTKLGSAQASMISLTEKGKEVARAMGYEPVESEWERLMRLHGGKAQAKHAAMVCTFAYHARKRGWRTEVCPVVEGNADPDVLIEKGEKQVYVEVEAESGSDERRAKKWRNAADLQGFVALAAVNGSMRKRLVSEAKGASKHGVATDIQYLIQNPEGDLWAESW